MNNKRFAIFASGNGSNAEVLARHALKNDYSLAFVLTDKANAGVIDRMKSLEIQTVVIEKNKLTKKEHEDKIRNELNKFDVRWIFLAGYMRILSPKFLKCFYDKEKKINRVVNIHPSLLPSFPGKSGYQDAYKYGVKTSGVTIHFVDDGIDSGSIISQRSFDRRNDDNIDSFIKRGQAIEHELYPEVMDQIMNDSFEIFERVLK